MRRRWLLPVLAATTAILAGSGQAAFAQEGTPGAGGAGGGDTTAACQQVEPRDAEFFAGIEGTPAAEQEQAESQGTPAGTDAETETSATLEGEAVDEATVGEITELYETLVACLNDGDYLRAYALYTDDYLARNLSAETIGQLEATPVPVEESTRSEFRGVIDARAQDEGRIVALVMVNNPQSGDIIIRSTVVQEGERLRIDEESIVEAVDQGASAGTAEATPNG
jgi:ribosomal protein S16